MDNAHAIILALVQGLTEFLPISSSAHLILMPHLLGWQDQGLAFDVAVHVGTLIAVVFYFRHDISRLFLAWVASCIGRPLTHDARLAWLVVLATLPVMLAGLVLHDYIASNLRSPLVIATTTIVFGLVLLLADRMGCRQRALDTLNRRDALFIGIAQAIALIPGTSRSGITMTAALMLGLTRSDAARFSFLLAVPTILVAGGFETLNLLESPDRVDWGVLLTGIVVATVSAWLCIHFFLKLIDRIGMLPFVIYRLLLGIALLAIYL